MRPSFSRSFRWSSGSCDSRNGWTPRSTISASPRAGSTAIWSDAAAIQRSLLPEAPPQIPGLVFAWFYRACKQVGGDMFNVFRLSEDHVGVYVLDVSGHGTSAALHSVSLSQVLNPFPQQGGIMKRAGADGSPSTVTSPCEVAAELNRRFPLVAQSGQYFTFLYGILDLPTLRFCYVRAGHPGPIAVSRGRARFHDEGGGVPIGVVDDARLRKRRDPARARGFTAALHGRSQRGSKRAGRGVRARPHPGGRGAQRRSRHSTLRRDAPPEPRRSSASSSPSATTSRSWASR